MTTLFNIAQITDCHLFADSKNLHFGANVYQNLMAVLADIKQHQKVDLIVFTGDLTQDHSDGSYQRFVEAIKTCQIVTPVYYLPGNHDELAKLDEHLRGFPFNSDKVIESKYWQIILLNSKSAAPAGQLSAQSLTWLQQTVDVNKQQLLMMHHHPVDVGYFIDRHGLINQDEFWQTLQTMPSIKAIACGHVHQALNLLPADSKRSLPVYTCPATSIQFNAEVDTVSNNGQGPGYRVFTLGLTGQLSTETIFLQDEKLKLKVKING
ncbi:MAG: Icc protein [Alteromonadaceae bacterium]|jgi:Icc protein